MPVPPLAGLLQVNLLVLLSGMTLLLCPLIRLTAKGDRDEIACKGAQDE